MKPVSETAYYCCGARMLDASSRKPIANDTLASVFMDTQGKAVFHRFRHEKIANASCVVRHHMIDNGINDFLEKYPDGSIIILGAGFDTRSYRFVSGNWIELDEHAVIDIKERKLPQAKCPNRLQRFGIDFSTNELDQCLQKLATENPVLLVIEGVTMYLDSGQLQALLKTIKKHFPNHVVICDLLKKRFQKWFGRSIQRKITAMGNQFSIFTEPEEQFENQGYKKISYQSIVEKTLALRALPASRLLGLYVPAIVRDGYGIYVFSYGKMVPI